MEATKSFEFDYTNEKREIIHLKSEGYEYEDICKLAIAYKIKFDTEFTLPSQLVPEGCNREKKNDFEIMIPINTIDDVKCIVMLRLFYYTGKCIINPCNFQLIITDNDTSCFDNNDDDVYYEFYRNIINISSQENPNREEFIKVIMIMKYYFNKLKFSRYLNKFLLYDTRHYDLSSRVFSSCPNVKLDGDICPGCLDYTTLKLYRCKHHICIPCKGKLVNNKCPTCRKHIYDSDEDEDEDEDEN